MADLEVIEFENPSRTACCLYLARVKLAAGVEVGQGQDWLREHFSSWGLLHSCNLQVGLLSHPAVTVDGTAGERRGGLLLLLRQVLLGPCGQRRQEGQQGGAGAAGRAPQTAGGPHQASNSL